MDDVATFKLERKKSNSRLAGGRHFERDPWAVPDAAMHGVVVVMVMVMEGMLFAVLSMQKAAAEAGWTQPQLFERGSLMLRLLAEGEGEAIVPEAGEAAVNHMLEKGEDSRGIKKMRRRRGHGGWDVVSFVF